MTITEISCFWVPSLLSLLVTSFVVSRRLKRRKQHFADLSKDQRGSVNLQLVALLPLVIFNFLLVIETTNLMVAAIGVRAACAETTRAATVWLPMETPMEHRLNRIRDVATQNLMPFSSGMIKESQITRSGRYLRQFEIDQAVREFKTKHSGQARDSFLRKQFFLAERASIVIRVDEAAPTDVRFRINQILRRYPVDIEYARRYPQSTDFRANVSVRMTHYVPLQTPLFGRWFGTKIPGTNVYAVAIEANYSLPKEGIQGNRQRSSIRFTRD